MCIKNLSFPANRDEFERQKFTVQLVKSGFIMKKELFGIVCFKIDLKKVTLKGHNL